MCDWKVFELFETNLSSNAYTVGRHTEFAERKSGFKIFKDESEAKEYIINKSRETVPEFVNYTTFLPNGFNKEEAEEQFCFTNDKYLKYRRFFLNSIPFKELKRAMINDGIKVLESK